jgi:hypothetical protein
MLSNKDLRVKKNNNGKFSKNKCSKKSVKNYSYVKIFRSPWTISADVHEGVFNVLYTKIFTFCYKTVKLTLRAP